MRYILDILGVETVANLLLSVVVTIISDIDESDRCLQTDLSIMLGNKLFNLVLRSLYSKYLKTAGLKVKRSALVEKYLKPATVSPVLTFTSWVECRKNSGYVSLFNTDELNISTYTASTGSIFIQQLIELYILVSVIEKNSFNREESILSISDKTKESLGDDLRKVRPVAIHLPMVEEPNK